MRRVELLDGCYCPGLQAVAAKAGGRAAAPRFAAGKQAVGGAECRAQCAVWVSRYNVWM